MIPIVDKSILLITPPKCGSTSLHEHLCCKLGYPWMIGPSKYGGVVKYDKHSAEIPEEWPHLKPVVLVRNPLTRLPSLYSHHVGWCSWKGLNPLSKDHFLDSVASGKDLFYQPVSERYSGYVGYWKIENIREELESIGISGVLGVSNKSKNSFSFTDEQLKRVDSWIELDSKEFGYD